MFQKYKKPCLDFSPRAIIYILNQKNGKNPFFPIAQNEYLAALLFVAVLF